MNPLRCLIVSEFQLQRQKMTKQSRFEGSQGSEVAASSTFFQLQQEAYRDFKVQLKLKLLKQT